jgi:hypothetical protein
MSRENWLRAGRPGFDYRERQHYSLLHGVYIGSGAQPVSYKMGIGGTSSGGKAAVA